MKHDDQLIFKILTAVRDGRTLGGIEVVNDFQNSPQYEAFRFCIDNGYISGEKDSTERNFIRIDSITDLGKKFLADFPNESDEF